MYKNSGLVHKISQLGSVFFAVGLLCCTTFSPFVNAIPLATDVPEFVSSFGSRGSVNVLPSDMAEYNGSLYVLDQNIGLVKTDLNFEYQGTLVTNTPFTTCVTVPSSTDFCGAESIAITADGIAFIATSNNSVFKYNSSGTLLASWGTAGSGNGEFSSPQGIAVDSANNVYVADTQNHRVQKFDQNGTYLTQWGVQGGANGEFNSPQGIAVDGSNNVYVVERDGQRVQKFDANGAYVTKWGSYGSGDGQFAAPSDISVDDSGNVYVADTSNSRIQKFTGTGTYTAQWGSNGMNNGEFTETQGIATGGSNVVYAADYDGTSYGRLQKFSNSGVFSVSRTEAYGTTSGRFMLPFGITHDTKGYIYIADTYNHRIQKMTSTGEFVKEWGSLGSGNDEFNGPFSIAVDQTSNIYVADVGNNRIQKFDQSGNYITQWGVGGSGNSEFSYPQAVAVDTSNNVYVADTQNHRIQKFDQNGTYLAQWGSEGTGDGQFSAPSSIAVDASGNVFVVDYSGGNTRIQKFDQNGTYLAQWGSEGTGDGQFNTNDPPFPMMSLAVDVLGNVYISDSGNYRIQKFDNNGNYLAQWGEPGFGEGQFFYNGGLTIDSNGTLYSLGLFGTIQKFAYPQEEVSLGAVNPQGINLSSDIILKTGAFADVTCSEVAPESSQLTQDDSYLYPLGMVRFCLNVADGSTQNIDLYFETDLAVNDVVARKYNASTGQYQNITGASITEVTQTGKRYLKVSYSITDGGELDEDGEVNGEIVDPVGLAQATGSGLLASTGLNRVAIQAGVVLLLGLGLVGLRIRRKIRI